MAIGFGSETSLVTLFSELKRRNVIRVALFYIVAAWVVVQVAETVLPIFEVPDGVLRGLIVLLGLGLVPALVLSWIYEITPDGLKGDGETATPEGEVARTGRKLNWATLVIAVLALAFLIADRMTPSPHPGLQVAEQLEEPEAGPGDGFREASIAVLPFADLSPGGDQEYFSDGIAEEILNALVKVEGLQVASRTSSFAFKGQESLGMRQIADKLAVRHVLEGSVRKAGDHIRITAQLVDAGVDRHLWSDAFDRPLTAENVFAIQDEIATAIVSALAESLGIQGVGEVRRDTPTENFRAYDLYLRARALFQARHALDVADELLVRALDQDAGFAKAWELRAALQSLKKEYGYSDQSREELHRLGVEYAEKALAIEPASAMALATLANIRSNDMRNLQGQHDIAGIIRDLERALEIEPRNANALNWLGLTFAQVGKIEEALEQFRRCMDYEPLFGPCAENEYEALLSLGRPDEAYEHMQAALEKGTTTGQYINFSLLARFDQKMAFMLACNQSGWLSGWRRHGAIYDAYKNPGGDHRALVEEILQFVAAEKTNELTFLGNLLIPIGAYDLKPYPLLMWEETYAGYRQSSQFRHYIRQSGAFDYWREHGYPPQCRPSGDEDFICD